MKAIFERVGNVIVNKYLIIVIVCLALVIPAIIGASQIGEELGLEALVLQDAQEYKDFNRLNDNFSENVILLVLTADSTEQLVQRDNILAMETFEEQMASQLHVTAAIGPAYLIKYAMTQLSGTSSIPDAEMISFIIIDPVTGSIRPEFAGLFPDQRHAMVSVVAEAEAEEDDLVDLVNITEAAAADAGFSDVTYIIAGQPVTKAEASEKLNESLNLMIGLAVVLMLLILALVFRVRNLFIWRWLPLGVVLIGIIYTFGIMGFAGIPMTYIAIASFPILIGLGVGFSIQFHDRYDKAMRRGESPVKAVIEAMTRMGPVTGIALIAVCLGFAGLLTSPVPMIVDFGYSLIIGTIVMYLLAAFLLLPALYWNDHRKEFKKAVASAGSQSKGEGFVERGLRRLSPAVIKHPVIITLLAIILCVSGFILDVNIDSQPDTLKYLSDDLPSIQGLNLVVELTGGRTPISILVEADNVADPEVMEWMLTVEDRIKTNEPESAGSLESFVDIVAQANNGAIPDATVTKQILSKYPRPFTLNLINDDFTAANMSFSLPAFSADDLSSLRDRLEGYTADAPEGVTVAVTGSSIVQGKLGDGLTSDRIKMTLIGIGLVFAGLLVLFRFNLKRAIVAALPTVFIIGWAAIIVYLMGIEYTPAGATRAAMAMGIGVMFTVLLMNRYYEERDSGQTPVEAITTAMVRVGRPIIACGLTVIGGFAALLIATDFPLITDFGIITLVTVFFGLVSTLVVLPPMLIRLETWEKRISSR